MISGVIYPCKEQVRMKDKEQRAAAEKFAADWKDKGYEKGQCQAFWLSLLRYVYDFAVTCER